MDRVNISPSFIEECIGHRRYLHQYPELSGQEFDTYNYIKGHIEQLHLEILPFEPPSLVALLRGTKGEKTIALRADMDALPVFEEGDKPGYLSKRPGVAHVCGHDGHMAILLTVAKWMVEHRERIEHNVIFIFQSSEEDTPSGAEKLVKEGVLEGVDAIFGLHLWQGLEKGAIGLSHGSMMASTDDFVITIKGSGGHGSMPHETVDPIYISSHIIQSLQAIVSRQMKPLEPAVISVGKIEAGTIYNIIPSTATLSGTIRCLSYDAVSFIQQRIEKQVQGICASFGAESDVQFIPGTPPLINDQRESKYVEEVIKASFGAENFALIEPVMGGEDFSFYLKHKPGAFVFVGMQGEKSRYPHHHPKFDLDEDVFGSAIQLFIHLVLNYNEQGGA